MILFLADIHIKLGQKNVPREWALNRFKLFQDSINELSKEVDTIVIGGDTFDRVPTIDELELYFDFISGLSVPTYIFDGNHEATKKGKTFLSQLSSISNLVNSNITIVTDIQEFDFGTIVPYCKLKEKGVFDKCNKSLPLFTHVRGEIPPHVKPEIDLDLLKDFPVVYAGDLHAHSNSQRNIVYPGSPMTTSFHRSETSTGYILLNGTDWKYHTLDLPQLIRKNVSTKEEMVPTNYHHTIYELEGALTDLASVKDSELLDKKIVKRNSEAALILEKDMTIEQELNEYLMYILELDEAEVEELIGVFHDNIRETEVG